MMSVFPDPMRLFGLHMQTSLMVSESVAVIWMRALGMSGLWSVDQDEGQRMISEKETAFADARQAAMTATLQGLGPDRVLAATLKPIRMKTRANARRLTRGGLPQRQEN